MTIDLQAPQNSLFYHLPYRQRVLG